MEHQVVPHSVLVYNGLGERKWLCTKSHVRDLDFKPQGNVFAGTASPCLIYTQPVFLVGILTMAGRHLADTFILILMGH